MFYIGDSPVARGNVSSAIQTASAGRPLYIQATGEPEEVFTPGKGATLVYTGQRIP